MEVIWAPWRIGYILGEKEKGCFLCRKIAEKADTQNFILERGRLTLVILNIFPYNNGHLMIAPLSHKANLEDLTAPENCELMEKISKWVKILKLVLKPEGFNLGLNLGKAAGAGLEDHLHFHIVPRWVGDNNFMPVLAETKVIPDSLERCYQALKKADSGKGSGVGCQGLVTPDP